MGGKSKIKLDADAEVQNLSAGMKRRVLLARAIVRKTDILLLADYFLEGYAEENGREVKRLSTPAIDMLMGYHWPGNVRQLKNAVERLVIMCDSSQLSQDVLCGFNQLGALPDQRVTAARQRVVDRAGQGTRAVGRPVRGRPAL